MTQRQRWILCITSLYSLLLLPVWDTALVPLSALTAFIIALRQGAFSLVRQHYAAVLGCWALLMVVNVAASVMPAKAFTGGFHILRGLSMFMPALLLAPLVPAPIRYRTLQGLVVLVAIGALGLLIQIAPATDHYEGLLLLSYDWFGNLHNLVNVMAGVLIAALVLGITARCRRDRMLALVTGLPVVLLLLWLSSEGAWIALLISLAAGCILFAGRGLQLLAWLGIAGLTVLLHLFYLTPELAQQLTGLELGSLVARTEIYTALLASWLDAPWLGWGFSTYKYLPAAQVAGVEYLYPHHLYLEALFSAGLVGCLLLLLLFRALGRYIDWSAVRSDPLALLGFLLLCYTAAKGLTDMKLFSAQTFSLFGFCFGLMSRLPVHSEPALQAQWSASDRAIRPADPVRQSVG